MEFVSQALTVSAAKVNGFKLTGGLLKTDPVR
jgi:hypothetical protein